MWSRSSRAEASSIAMNRLSLSGCAGASRSHEKASPSSIRSEVSGLGCRKSQEETDGRPMFFWSSCISRKSTVKVLSLVKGIVESAEK